ncbi:MAG: signal recognition particle protein, partial [Actinobacteria bacterium]|nr:signal recognition particle protein [Actinomycetota bacterium]
MPGMPSMGGGKKSKGKMAKPAKQAKGKSRSGNPAKRADQGAGVTTPTGGPGSMLGAGSANAVPADFDYAELPPELKKLLG